MKIRGYFMRANNEGTLEGVDAIIRKIDSVELWDDQACVVINCGKIEYYLECRDRLEAKDAFRQIDAAMDAGAGSLDIG